MYSIPPSVLLQLLMARPGCLGWPAPRDLCAAARSVSLPAAINYPLRAAKTKTLDVSLLNSCRLPHCFILLFISNKWITLNLLDTQSLVDFQTHGKCCLLQASSAKELWVFVDFYR